MNRDKKLQWFYNQIIELRNELFYFAYSILRSVPESEDAVSSAIIKAHTHIDSLRNRSALKTWLFRIVRNECYSMAKARQRTIPIDEDTPSRHEAGTEQRIDVENALARLPQEQREAITLYLYLRSFNKGNSRNTRGAFRYRKKPFVQGTGRTEKIIGR